MEWTPGHPIKVAVRRTGLSAHVIRVWEKRYGAVVPARTPTNRRLYSDEDIVRLQWLRQAVEAGQSIGRIAGLPTPELVKLVRAEGTPALSAPKPAGGEAEADGSGEPPEFLERALVAVQGLDAAALEEQLVRASAALSQPDLLEELVQPLMERVGRMWHEGNLRVADEHMATAVVRSFVGSLQAGFQLSETAPHAVATTPAGQLHEMGALLASVAAASEGWNSTFLGPNLPAEEIAGAAAQKGARAVLLSISYPGDDPRLGGELLKLGRLLGAGTALFAGGRAVPQYRRFLEGAGGVALDNLGGLRDALGLLRRETAAPGG